MTTAPPPPQPGGDPVRQPGSISEAPLAADASLPPEVGTTPPPPPEPVAPPPPPEPKPTARTRISSTYVAVAVGVVVLILLLIFIIQNLSDASFHYLGLHFRLPVGLLMLISMVAGGVVVLAVSLARVFQLRVRARRATQHSSHRVS